jgi:hypothetical protein
VVQQVRSCSITDPCGTDIRPASASIQGACIRRDAQPVALTAIPRASRPTKSRLFFRPLSERSLGKTMHQARSARAIAFSLTIHTLQSYLTRVIELLLTRSLVGLTSDRAPPREGHVHEQTDQSACNAASPSHVSSEDYQSAHNPADRKKTGSAARVPPPTYAEGLTEEGGCSPAACESNKAGSSSTLLPTTDTSNLAEQDGHNSTATKTSLTM